MYLAILSISMVDVLSILGDTRYLIFRPSSDCLYCPYSIFTRLDTAQYSVFWYLILATLDNTQYLVHGYWRYCSILSILIFDTGYTGQYSVFGTWILVILLNIQYFEIRCWLYMFWFCPFSCGVEQQLRAGELLLYIYIVCVLVCVPHVLFSLFSRPQAGLADVGGTHNMLEVRKQQTSSTHWWPHIDAHFPIRHCFFPFCLFISLRQYFNGPPGIV